MRLIRSQATFLLATIITVAPAEAGATVTVYTDKAQWISAMGSHTKIDFTGYTANTNITTQYAALGVLFPEGDERFQMYNGYSDGWGLLSIPAHVTMSFTQPMYGMAIEYTGINDIKLFDHGNLFYTSQWFFAEFFPFVGVISTTPFDSALINDPSGGPATTIDNLYFGPAVPAPAALGLFAIGAMAPHRRRKESA